MHAIATEGVGRSSDMSSVTDWTCFVQVPDVKAPQKKLKAPSMSQRGLHLNGKPDVVVEDNEEVNHLTAYAVCPYAISIILRFCLQCFETAVSAQEASIAPSNASTNSANRGAEATLTRPSPIGDVGDDNIVGIITIEVGPGCTCSFTRETAYAQA